MKRVILVLIVFLSMSFVIDKEDYTDIAIQSSDCVRIYVKYSNGKKCTQGYVSGSVNWGGITKRVYLNDDGYADICYKSGNSLNTVFYNGKGYKGTYRKGHSYTIYLK